MAETEVSRFIEELKSQNEKALQEMKIELEREFQQKLKLILEGLTGGNSSENVGPGYPTSENESKGSKKSRTILRASIDDVETADESKHSKVKAKVLTSTGRIQADSQVSNKGGISLYNQTKQQKKHSVIPTVISDTDLQRFGPYHNSHDKELRSLAARMTKISERNESNSNDGINDALALATGKATNEVQPTGDQPEFRLLPTEKATLLAKINNAQDAGRDDQCFSTTDGRPSATDKKKVDQGSIANIDDSSAVDSSKYMLSCTKSMLRKTEYLLNESRQLSSTGRKSSTKSKSLKGKHFDASKSLPRLQPAAALSNVGEENGRSTDSRSNKFPPIHAIDSSVGHTTANEVDDNARYKVTVVSRTQSPVSRKGNQEGITVTTEAERIARLNQKLPEGWIHQRVNDFTTEPGPTSDRELMSEGDGNDGDQSAAALAFSRAEWENQIARHILSVFATTKAIASSAVEQRSHVHEARAVLDYVDKRKTDTVNSVSSYVLSNNVTDDVLGTAVKAAKQDLTGQYPPALGAAGAKSPNARTATDEGTSMAMSRSRQLLSRENNSKVMDVEQQRQMVFEAYNAASEESNIVGNAESSWTAIDGEQWGVNHDGFDFDLPNTAVVGEIPPPAVAATGVQGRPRSTSAKQRAAQSSTERTKSRSPDRPIFACRAFNTSACLANKQQAGDGDGDTEVLAATPLSPSPFLQSKYVSGVFLVANKEGQKMIVRGPPIVSPIWFVETGDVYLDWSDLPGGEKLQANLSVLYEHRRFSEFVMLVKETLLECHYEITQANLNEHIDIRANTLVSPTRQSITKNLVIRTNSPPRELTRHTNRFRTRYLEAGATVNTGMQAKQLAKCWYRLVITANAMATMCIEKEDYVTALRILELAKTWALNEEVLLRKNTCQELKAYVFDTFAYYYYVHSLSMAAIDFSKRAIAIYNRLGHVEGSAIGLLHIAAVECQLGKFKDSHKTLYQFLAMVEDGRMGLESASAKQLASVAVCYHNLAAVQMKLQVSDLACKSSQNARKIARLCLSVSNRWLPVFQRTHEMCLEDVHFRLSQRTDLDEKQKKLIGELAMDLYNPAPEI